MVSPGRRESLLLVHSVDSACPMSGVMEGVTRRNVMGTKSLVLRTCISSHSKTALWDAVGAGKGYY